MSRLRKSSVAAALAISLVGGFEGVREVAYLDPVGIPTACFGETRNIKLGMKFTRAECNNMLIEGLIRHEEGMMRCTKVDMPDTRYIALLSFTYNVGVGAYCGSTLVRKLNSGDTSGACDQLLRWDKAMGFRLPGLTKRRHDERELCLKGL